MGAVRFDPAFTTLTPEIRLNRQAPSERNGSPGNDATPHCDTIRSSCRLTAVKRQSPEESKPACSVLVEGKLSERKLAAFRLLD